MMTITAVLFCLLGALSAGAAEFERATPDRLEVHWAFRPLIRPAIPKTAFAEWVRTPVDAFIGARLEDNQLEPNPRAAKRVLLRRLFFDLTGLPPAPEEMDAFLADPSPGDEVYGRWVDRLLASERFGERWAARWLDVARFAESDGYENDEERPNAYPYRDFVIQAFNQDMAFDQFVRWQLAGDEWAPDDPAALAATGFCVAGPRETLKQDEQHRYDELDDMLATTGSAFLGLTIGCARCHDHKSDPISQREYYQLLGAFTTVERKIDYLATREQKERYEAENAESRTRRGRLNRRVLQLRLKYSPTTDEDLARLVSNEEKLEWDRLLREKLDQDRTVSNRVAKVLMISDSSAVPTPSYLLSRGDPRAKRGETEFGFPGVLTRGGEDPASWRMPGLVAAQASTGRRQALGAWLTDTRRGAGMLTARVIVNRLWQWHFGEGLVATPNDFGRKGAPPRDPELLDWLAVELIENGWRLKPIHRLIVMSSVYQTSSALTADQAERDPKNRWQSRHSPLRLEAGAVRDAILKTSGCLNLEAGGPGVKEWINPLALAAGSTAKWPADIRPGPATWRRSVYLFGKRSVVHPVLRGFDQPERMISSGRRLNTTTPMQALLLLNSRFVQDQARLFAARLGREAGPDLSGQIRTAFRLAFSREPEGDEIEASLELIDPRLGTGRSADSNHAREDGSSREELLADFCLVLLNANEFIFID